MFKCFRELYETRESSLKALKRVNEELAKKSLRLTELVEKKAGAIIWILIVIYTAYFSGYTLLMHYAFRTYAWDLGIFTQSLWTTLNEGKLFYYVVELPVNPSGSFLGTHFSPILFLVLPVYALFQSPETLLIFQSFILAVGALPVYWIAKEQLNDKLSGLGLACVYLLYPALHGVNCFDFHVEAFIPLFFLLSFHYIDKGKWLKALFFTLLMISTIEFAPILVMFLAAYLLIKNRTKRDSVKNKKSITKKLFPAILMITAIAWFYTAFYVMGSINILKTSGLPGNWTNWGSSLPEVLKYIITHPTEVIPFTVIPTEKVYYLLSLLAPLLMLPTISIEILTALPWLMMASLSDYTPYYSTYFQYSAFLIGQLFVATIFSVRKMFSAHDGQRKLKLQREMIALMILTTLLISVMISPVGLPAIGSRNLTITQHTELVHSILKLVPDNASIATQNDIFPHVAQRENVYILTWPMSVRVDFILVDVKSHHFLVGFLSTLSPCEALEKTIETGKYGLFASADGVLLFKKDYDKPVGLFVPYQNLFNSDTPSVFHLLPVYRSSRVVVDLSSYSRRIIVHEPDDLPNLVWVGPYTYIFAGEYTAVFRMKTKSENLNFTIDAAADSGRIICQRILNSSNFKAFDTWQEFALNFRIDGLKQMEFRGMCESSNTSVALDYVKIVQTGP